MGEVIKKKSFGSFLLQIALVLYFTISGFYSVRSPGTGEIAAAVSFFASGNSAKVIVIILAVLQMISGVYLLFSIFVPVGKLGKLFLAIILIMWLCIVVLLDVFGQNGILNGAFSGSFDNALSYLKGVAGHLLVVGSLMTVM